MMHIRKLVFIFALAWLMPAITVAASYPDRTIRIVVPFGPGSATDTLARVLAQGLSEDLNQSVIVENRPGAAGAIAAREVASAKPDGYTLILGSNGPFAANPSLYKNLSYSPIDDFEPIWLAGHVPQLLLTAGDAKNISTVQDIVSYAKSNSSKVNFGATNTTSQIWAELLKKAKGIDVPVILFKETGQMLTDVMTGRANFAFGSVAPARPLMDAGKIKAVAITGDKRMEALPDVPTLKESGFDEYNLDVWMALFAPKGTPAEIVMTLNEKLNHLLTTEKVKQIANQIGMQAAGGTPEALGAVVKHDVANWQKLVDLTGVTVN
ncbi:tripartite tricarboxylate transporter substrate binding protein [Alcaligenaceae bacterium]|nr:tripartite tricarboxylate transporter substrate binding protein [Alcaligenaceae bacterium]